MSAAISPPASRNAACPCGSGRRFKDCHGQVAATVEARPASGTLAQLQQALAAQQAGRLADAIALYDRVIDAAPMLFDAWHMRGVARFQRFDFDAAERDIRRALALRPGVEAARQNLSLVIDGRLQAEREELLCREVLPRYAALTVDPPRAPLDGVERGSRVFVIDACEAGSTLAEVLEANARDRGATVTRIHVAAGRVIEGEAADALAATGERDAIACAGCARPLGDWTLAAGAAVTALVADDVRLVTLLERLRELSGQGRRRVRLACSSTAPRLPPSLPHVASGSW